MHNTDMNETRTQDHLFADQSTTNYATEMSKMIPNLLTFHWRSTLSKSSLTDI